MRLAISLTPLPLTDALALAQSLARRPDLDPSQRLAADDWAAAASAALLRRDRAGLETLLRAELAPAVATAMALLGSTVVAASWWPDDHREPWVADLTLRLDKACLAILHATKVVRVAQRWQALVDPECIDPTTPEPGAGTRVLEKASHYLQADQHQDEARLAVSDDLAHALRNLASPVEALITSMDANRLDELITDPVQERLYQAYGAGAAALAYELALLGEGPLAEKGLLVMPE